MQISPATAELSARTQQLLLAQGGTYASRIGEADWMRSPVLLTVPPNGHAQLAAHHAADGLRKLTPLPPAAPSGSWMVLPWDEPSPEKLERFLHATHQRFGQLPDFVVLITSLGHVSEGWLARIGQQFGTEIAAIQVALGEVAGPELLAQPLRALFHEDTAELLAHVNPLEHLTELADPRDHAVYIERLRRATPRTLATKTLFGLNVAVYVIMLLATGFDLFGGFSGQALVDWGANVGALTQGQGQWWRLLSCTFVHANLLHIGMNMWALRVLGDMAERLFGSAMFTAVYLLAGLGGSVASLAFTLADNPHMPSIGASGAVFGIMGGLVGFMLSRRGSVPPALFKSLLINAAMFTGLNLMIGLSISAIDNAAHMGGLFTGVLAGALLSRDLPPAPQPSPGARLVGIGVVLAVLGLAISML